MCNQDPFGNIWACRRSAWGKIGADGGLKDVTATYLIDWVIDHRRGAVRSWGGGRGSDCNEGWEVAGVWRWRLINHIDCERLEGPQRPWRTTPSLSCAPSVTPTDDMSTGRCACQCKWQQHVHVEADANMLRLTIGRRRKYWPGRSQKQMHMDLWLW